jgi:hypothetical protein
MPPIKPVEVKCGKLMTGVSAESAGIGNYTIKQDFRRVLERDIRAEGYEWYRPNSTYDKIIQSIPTGSTEPITVISECSLGNGRIALVAGNQTTLWRYMGLEEPDYYDTEDGISPNLIPAATHYIFAYYQLTGLTPGKTYNYSLGSNDISLANHTQVLTGNGTFVAVLNYVTLTGVSNGILITATITTNTSSYFDTEGGLTYFDDGMSGWEVIGTGFSTTGRRWEAVQVGDYLVLNNGADLPMTYNLQESAVKPIYELREQQIACVGTIAAQDGILCCMDITQINDVPFLAIMQPIAAAVNAAQNTTGMVTPNAATLFPGIAASALVGLTLFWGSGQTTYITSIDSNGFINTNTATVPVKDGAGNSPFTTGWTPTYASPAIKSGPVSVENPAAYALFNDPNSIQRIGYRFFPSMPSQPRRFGASIPVSFDVGSQIGTLLFPVRSIPELVSSGVQTSFQITNIGIGSTNLTANVIFTTYGITQMVFIDQPAMTQQPFGITSDFQDQLQSSLALIEAADAAQSFAGVFEDLQDDEGIIIKALTLQGQLVIYKETPVIFLASYTGDLTTPFQFQRIPIQAEAAALHHRNTLIAGGGGYFGSYHLYAGKNAFYKFTLFTGTPTEDPTLQLCQNTFFENASDNENTFSVENPLTREIFFVFPVTDGDLDNAVCLDYAYNSARTTTAEITAAAKARHPVTRDYWFILGQNDGSLKRYGLFDAPFESSLLLTATLGNGTVVANGNFFTTSHVGKTIVFNGGVAVAIAEYVSPTTVTVYANAGVAVTSGQTFMINPGIWHRDGDDYNSVIQSGLDAFGLTHGEKQLNEYVLTLSSKSPNTPVTVGFLGGVNPAEGTILQSGIILSPDFTNLLKPTLLQYYIGINVTVAGMNNPIEIVGHLFNVVPVTSHSFGRRIPTTPKICGKTSPVFAPVLSAKAVLGSQINLSWIPAGWPTGVPVNAPITYTLYRSTNPMFVPSTIYQIASGLTGLTYSDMGLVIDTTYYYFVFAVDSLGNTIQSNQAFATTEFPSSFVLTARLVTP